MKSRISGGLIALLAAFLVSCQPSSTVPDRQGETDTIESPKVANHSEPAAYTVEVTDAGAGQWGYKILQAGKLVINQPHIPAIQGSRGFDTPEKAEKTAWYVVGKMQAGMMPPAITRKELDSLGVL